MTEADLETRPVRAADVPDLDTLFEGRRSTRGCWCTAFCSTRSRFALGWLTGGNRQRFSALAAGSRAPMGVLASRSGEPVGWAACGPRSRYTAALAGRSAILRDLDRGEDDIVWLVPCLFVREGHRGGGVTHALVRAAVELAAREGAVAIEAWPCASSERRPADAFLGREELFEQLGFGCVARPGPRRSLMRLELTTRRPEAR